MDIDTGASVSIISEQTFKELWGQDRHPALQRCGIRLRTYTGELLPIMGHTHAFYQWQGPEIRTEKQQECFNQS